MKVSDLITQLQDMNPDEIIVASYWTHDDFPEDVDWPEAVEIIERRMDWSDTSEHMDDLLTIIRAL